MSDVATEKSAASGDDDFHALTIPAALLVHRAGAICQATPGVHRFKVADHTPRLLVKHEYRICRHALYRLINHDIQLMRIQH